MGRPTITLEGWHKVFLRPCHHRESVSVFLEEAEVPRAHSICRQDVDSVLTLQGSMGLM